MQTHLSPSLDGPSPTDVVALLSGSSSVSLAEFANETAISGALTHPSTPFIPARRFDQTLPLLEDSAERWRKVGRCLIGLSLLMIGLAIGALAVLARVEWLPSSTSTVASWSVSQIVEKGVVVKMGDRTSLIPVGGKLPNGSIVVSVFPSRSVVVLDDSTVMLRGSSPRGSQP